MAFTSAEHVQIRKYLGYPTLFRYKDPRLESQIVLVGDDVDSSAETRAILAKIVLVEAHLSTSLEFGGMKRAEDVEWYPGAGMAGNAAMTTARSEGMRLCGQLSTLFGVPLYSNAFGSGGYPGDAFMGHGNQGSGPMRMG